MVQPILLIGGVRRRLEGKLDGVVWRSTLLGRAIPHSVTASLQACPTLHSGRGNDSRDHVEIEVQSLKLSVQGLAKFV